MKIKKLAIVGLGSIGRRHIRIMKEIRPEIEIILVRSGFGRSWPEEKLATQSVNSVNEAVEAEVEAAIISSPATVHLRQALEFSKAGVHVLIEKPLSHSLDGINQLQSIVADKKNIALVGYVLRYAPCAIKFKQWLDKDDIGKLLHAKIECGSYLPDWRPEQDYRKTVSASSELGGGVLAELSHDLDYLHWFFGTPSRVQARLSNSNSLELDVDDQADLILNDSNGFPITVNLDFCRRHPTRKCIVQTTQGQLEWDAIKKQVTWRACDVEPVVEQCNYDRDYIYRSQLEHFLDCIEQGNTPRVSLDEGIDVLQLIDAAQRASDSNKSIFI